MEVIVKVKPSSKKDKLKEEKDLFGKVAYQIETKQPAQDGKANDAVVNMLAKHLNVEKENIKIIKGRTNPKKTMYIKNLDAI